MKKKDKKYAISKSFIHKIQHTLPIRTSHFVYIYSMHKVDRLVYNFYPKKPHALNVQQYNEIETTS